MKILIVCDISYDESYGISGRLLIFCQLKNKLIDSISTNYNIGNKYCLKQLFNYNELEHLTNELNRLKLLNEKIQETNMIIQIYQYLYGKELVDLEQAVAVKPVTSINSN